MRIDAITPGQNPTEELSVIIEVPVGSELRKYGLIWHQERCLSIASFTRQCGTLVNMDSCHILSEDGDPIDVLVCNTRAIVPGAVIPYRPFGC